MSPQPEDASTTDLPTPALPEILRPSAWQMSLGERSALEGLLSSLSPRLSIEIGTAEGGSLSRVAKHSAEVHSFDLVEPEQWVQELENVTLHTGDSHALLPEMLARFADEGRNVDFALVDGDHSAEGVKQDVEDLLNSPSVQQTIIVFHDTANEEVRRGLDAVAWERWDKVQHVDLDAVAGYLFREPLLHELWGGLGIVLVDAASPNALDPRQQRVFETAQLLVHARDFLQGNDQRELRGDLGALREDLAAQREDTAAARSEAAALRERVAGLEDELRRADETMRAMKSSPSWRLTAPLRGAKRIRRR